MCQLLVGNSVTPGTFGVAVVREDASGGVGKADLLSAGGAGVEGAAAEHAAVTTRVSTAKRLSSPRPSFTPPH